MAQIDVRDAVPNDVEFLRDGLRALDDEMKELAGAIGVQGEGRHGLNIEGCLQRDVFLVAANGTELGGFMSIYFPYPPPGIALVPPRQQAMINTAFVLIGGKGLPVCFSAAPKPNAEHGARPASISASSKAMKPLKQRTERPDTLRQDG
jgi:hypothetical protein